MNVLHQKEIVQDENELTFFYLSIGNLLLLKLDGALNAHQ